tara:strand:+ start:186 stop:443 length:258 start_codon:yes stop_codon:yes gene_type:complete
MLQENIMSSFTDRVYQCKKHGWNDLLTVVDNLHTSLHSNPEAARQIVKGMQSWIQDVDTRQSLLTPNEVDLQNKNPLMDLEKDHN